MMAAEKRIVMETIVNLKRALAVNSDASESDDSIAYPSNRGRKLKRKARFVHEGALNDAKGPRTYKEEIEYFGKRRKIIWRKEKPRKQVEDEDEESSEDSDEDEGNTSDDADPYADVKLDKILAPLESAADLPSHPSLSHIYTNTTLNELLQQSLDKLCEEHEHTMKLKNLLTVFLGDDPYVNLEKMEWANEDYATIARERGQMLLRELGALASGSDSTRESISDPSGMKPLTDDGGKPDSGGVPVDEDTEMETAVNGTSNTATESQPDEPQWPNHLENDINGPPPADKDVPPEEDPDATQELKMEDFTQDSNPSPPPPPPPQQIPPPRRMTTRSAHNSLHPTPPTLSPQPLSHPVEVDPFFFPPNYTVDRNFGLPAPEAEDTRRLLATAVQRQDEFLRGLNKVRDGLLRAERFRKYVWGWCRAMEGTREYLATQGAGLDEGWKMDEEVGYALSDGEDWYDMDGWQLEEVLEKGKEEEDEGGAGEQPVQGKKTRGRRAVGN